MINNVFDFAIWRLGLVRLEKTDAKRSGIAWLKRAQGMNTLKMGRHEVGGMEGTKFDLNLLLDVDANGDLDVINTEENNNSQNDETGVGLVRGSDSRGSEAACFG